MPTIIDERVALFAHCPDALCVGYAQVEVEGIRTLVSETIGDRGGDGVFVGIVEKVTPYLRFANDGAVNGSLDPDAPNDMPCPECGKLRELSDQVRPTYHALMGPPDALLRARRAGVSAPTDADGLLAAAAAAEARKESPLELLQRRFISGEIEEEEFVAKRAVLGGDTVPEPKSEPKTARGKAA